MRLLISDQSGVYVYDGDGVSKIDGVPSLDKAVIYYERIFGIVHKRVVAKTLSFAAYPAFIEKIEFAGKIIFCIKIARAFAAVYFEMIIQLGSKLI